MSQTTDWMQYAEQSQQGHGNDWSQYAEQGPQHPRFLERTDRRNRGLEDVAEGTYDMWANLPESFQGLGQTIGSGIAQAQDNPKRFAQNVGGVFGELGTHFGNLPGATDKYLATRGEDNWETRLLRRFLQGISPKSESESWSPDDNMLQKIMKSIHLPKPGQFNYAEGLGREPAKFEKEGQTDELIRQYGPTMLASPGGAGSIAAQVFGSEENPFGIMTAPTVAKAGPTVAKTIGKGIAKGAEKAKEAGKNIYEPIKKSSDLAKEKIETGRNKLAAQASKEKAESIIKETFEKHLEEDKGTSKLNAAKDLTDAARELEESGSADYNEFNAAKNEGQKRVFKPLQPEFFAKQYPFPKGALSSTTQKMIDKIIGTYEETMKLDPLTGQPKFNVNKNVAQPKVEDYVKLQKHLKTEIRNIKERARNKDMPQGEKDILNAQASSLNRLHSDLNNRINGSISEKSQVKYAGLQKFWEWYVGPFQDSATLKNMIGHRPKVKTTSILDTLDSEGAQHLKRALLENEKVAASIGKHDWRSVDVSNPKALTEALKGDLGKTLTPEMRKYVQEHLDILTNEQKTIKELTRKLKEDGLSKAEVDAKISKYTSIISKTGIGGGLFFAAKILTGIL